MKYNTRDFGEVEVQNTDILHFIQPPFGFESSKRFVLLFDDDENNGLGWLQSVDDAALCFIVMDANYFAPTYAPSVPTWVVKKLGGDDISAWTICVIPDDMHKATANLKSPIFINLKTQKAMQVILPEDYPLRQHLLEQEG